MVSSGRVEHHQDLAVMPVSGPAPGNRLDVGVGTLHGGHPNHLGHVDMHPGKDGLFVASDVLRVTVMMVVSIVKMAVVVIKALTMLSAGLAGLREHESNGQNHRHQSYLHNSLGHDLASFLAPVPVGGAAFNALIK